ncbi:MAG TPA: PEP-CTERM sorting domain-containing protein [Tepidisphaeraceae bacterium]
MSTLIKSTAALTLFTHVAPALAASVEVPVGPPVVINSGDSVVAGDYLVYGTLNVNGGTFEPDSLVIDIDRNETAPVGGVVNFNGGDISGFGVTVQGDGTLNVSTNATLTSLNALGKTVINQTFTVQGTTTSNFDISVAQGATLNTGAFEQRESSFLRGNGTVKALNFDFKGFTAPGGFEGEEVIGALNLASTNTSDNTITFSNTYEVDLRFAGADSEADLLNIAGDVVIAPRFVEDFDLFAGGDVTLNILDLPDGESFKLGDRFPIFTADSIVGEFAGNESLPSFFNEDGSIAGFFTLEYTSPTPGAPPTTVSLVYVPEPAAAALLLLILGLMARRRRV